MNNGKVRIYELSKELNLDNKELLAICDQLNIAVKSHSSTITESEAQRIRSAAEKLPPNRHQTSQTGSRSRPATPKKPEILEIRKPKVVKNSASNNPEASAATDQQAAHNNEAKPLSSPRPFAPTVPPMKPVASTRPVQNQSENQQKPAVANNSNSNRNNNQTADTSKTRPEKPAAVAPKAVSPVEKPQLVAPPQRPAAPKATANVSGVSVEKPILRRNKDQQGQGKQKVNKQQQKPADTAKPLPQKQVRSGASAPSKPEIRTNRSEKPASPQRPSKPGRSTEYPAASAVPAPVKAIPPNKPAEVSSEEYDDNDVVTETTIELKRPTPPRLNRGGKKRHSEVDTLDEVKESSKVGKGPAKNKRQKPIVDDFEDDDLLDDENQDAVEAIQVSNAIARPPKPKSAKPAQAVPRATPSARTKKPSTSRGEQNQNRRRETEQKAPRPEKLQITGTMTVQELSEALAIADTEIVKILFLKGMAVSITQNLDVPTVILVANEAGVEVETQEPEAEARKVTEMIDVEDLEYLHRRPPVVTIMGHVDHGKTTLLDSIRKSKVAAGEAGGITQHIGAYHVDLEHNDKQEQIVFLDTPGHEAFTAMRARGARVTDIAILVVAADDGVRPQTIEAISHAQAAKVPIIVAVNKIDKEEAQPDRVKQELTQYGLTPEEWGGETIMVPVSAIKGENLDTLLEMILLVAEVEELNANPDRLAKGTVIEAHLDKAKGAVATLLIQNGTLKVGDILVAGSVFGKVRAMVDDRNERVTTAAPSFAVEVLGLNDVPAAGDEFEVFNNEKEARALASDRAEKQRQSRLMQGRVTLTGISAQAQEGELKELNLIIKADVQGSIEAILGSLQQIPQNEVQIRLLLAAPGEVTQTDIDLAAASGAVIIGFNTTYASGARHAADEAGVDVREYNIIYKLLEDIQGALEGLLEPELVEEALGQAEVRAVFPVGRGAVAGCYIQSGKLLRNSKLRVRRGDRVIYEGVLDSLKRMKEDVREVNSGYECGIGIDKFNSWQEGDIIEAYQMVTKRRTLSLAR